MMEQPVFNNEAFKAACIRTDAPISLYRNTLNQSYLALESQFEKGISASSLVKQRSDVVDQILIYAWQHCAGDVRNFTEIATVVAVGGYGRGELHPHSDIDIMILLLKKDNKQLDEAIEKFIIFLWDIGLEIGHSVRTVKDCITQAKNDITIATNLMESRIIAGSEPLFTRMRSKTGPDRLWSGRKFFEAKWQEQIARHHKYNDTAYNLEPNIKEGPGGLRDIQMIGWVVKRHFGAQTLHDLVKHDFLTENEYQTLIDGQEFLWRIRMALHFMTGRREDRLLFDHQKPLAAQFGYEDKGHQLDVEQFMKTYYRTIGELGRLNEMLLQLFQEEILLSRKSTRPVRINERFQAQKGFIEVSQLDVFDEHPSALLEIFLLLQQRPELKGVRAGTIRLIRNHLHLIDDTFRDSPENKNLFMAIIRQPQGITNELRRMHRYGVLGAYIEAFGRIIGQMQYDLFHAYTVDEHTLFVVRNLRRFAVSEFKDEFPMCSEIISQIKKPEILYLAGLFHDIAKGRGGDHSELGADDALNFCLQHGMNRLDGNNVAWLVKNHLIMSMTAQRKDISDPDIVSTFAKKVGNVARLDYLYLLTVADIRGTNLELWNSWKGALLSELYLSAKRVLRRGSESPIDHAEIIAETQSLARELLHLEKISDNKINVLWDDLGDDYFLRYTPDDICNHTVSILNSYQPGQPLVSIYEPKDFRGTAIFIYTKAEKHLFASVTATLDQSGLTIADARIITSQSNYTLDTYIVFESSGKPVNNSFRNKEIKDALVQKIMNPVIGSPIASRGVPRQHKHFKFPTTVIFNEDINNQRTIMEVTTTDAPGLLAKIGLVLQHRNIHIQNAKIGTIGSRAEDIFFITDENNKPLNADTSLQMEQEIIRVLSE